MKKKWPLLESVHLTDSVSAVQLKVPADCVCPLLTTGSPCTWIVSLWQSIVTPLWSSEKRSPHAECWDTWWWRRGDRVGAVADLTDGAAAAQVAWDVLWRVLKLGELRRRGRRWWCRVWGPASVCGCRESNQGGGRHHRHRLNRCHFHGNARILLRHLCFGRHGRTGTGDAGKIHCDGKLLLVYRAPPPAPENSVEAKNGPWHSPNLGKESELGSDAGNVESSRQSGPSRDDFWWRSVQVVAH